jgi:hypothetical protein
MQYIPYSSSVFKTLLGKCIKAETSLVDVAIGEQPMGNVLCRCHIRITDIWLKNIIYLSLDTAEVVKSKLHDSSLSIKN